MNAPPTLPGTRYLGRSILRGEDHNLLTGHGSYVDDHALPGMLHAAFVRSSIAKGRILSIDTSAAKTSEGVVAVFTGEEIHAHHKVHSYLLGIIDPSKVWVPRAYPLADGDVKFVGDPVAIVVAESRYLAEDAAEKIVVDYAPEAGVVDLADAERAPRVHADIVDNIGFRTGSPPDPELDRTFADAAHVVEHTIRQQRHTSAPMETRGIIASFGVTDEATVWLASQDVHHARRWIAEAIGFPETAVRVIAGDVGGGFGLKYFVDRDELAVVIAAKLIRRPVKWIEDRGENLTVAGQSRDEEATCRLAFDADGHFLAARVFTGPYRVPRYGWQAKSVYTNTPGRVAYRGPWMMETLCRETAMDKAARQLGIDPLELRRRNIIRTDQLPWTTANGVHLDAITPDQTLELAAEMTGYAAFRDRQAALRAEGRYLGLGISSYIEPSAPSRGISRSDVAEMRVEPTGSVIVHCSAGSAGHGIETTMRQVAADALGVDIEQVAVRFGDTATVGYGAGSGGSRQGMVIGGAVKVAGTRMREKLIAIAAKLLDAAPEELDIAEGVISSGPGSNRRIGVGEVARIAYFDPEKLPEGMESGLDITYRYAPPMMTFSNATHICLAEVDTDTGFVRIDRWIVGEDCGVLINPQIVEGQVAGGIAQGIGGVLLEHIRYDDEGTPLSVSFKDYMMPTIFDIPPIEFGHLCTPSPTPTGVKGVGEGGAIVAPAAVINAVNDALSPLGVWLDKLPLSPSRVLAAIEGDTTGA
jgi:carbon-monoxide dehydrogenase large subunit